MHTNFMLSQVTQENNVIYPSTGNLSVTIWPWSVKKCLVILELVQ